MHTAVKLVSQDDVKAMKRKKFELFAVVSIEKIQKVLHFKSIQLSRKLKHS